MSAHSTWGGNLNTAQVTGLTQKQTTSFPLYQALKRRKYGRKKSTNSPTTSNELISYLENMGKENPVLIELEMTTRAFWSTFCRTAALHDNMKKWRAAWAGKDASCWKSLNPGACFLLLPSPLAQLFSSRKIFNLSKIQSSYLWREDSKETKLTCCFKCQRRCCPGKCSAQLLTQAHVQETLAAAIRTYRSISHQVEILIPPHPRNLGLAEWR